MSTVLTRFNGFILDHKDPKKGYAYSCPQCYTNTYCPQAMSSVVCNNCRYQGNVYAVPSGQITTGTVAAPTAGVAYAFRPLRRNGYGNIDIQCLKCGFDMTSKGSFGVAGPVEKASCGCGHSGLINWEMYCLSCLCNGGTLNKAVYVCSNHNGNHTASMVRVPTNVTRVGKCSGCACGSTCKKI